jgi:hypothetical protein
MDKLILSYKLVPELQKEITILSNKIQSKKENPIIKKIKTSAVISLIICSFIGGLRLGAEF